MNRKILVAGAVIIAATLVFIAWAVGLVGANPYWETETEFGIWGEEIIIEYTDGTTDSLKLLQTIPTAELTYEGKGVNTICYRFKAKATGTGYDEALIKFTDLSVNMWIRLSGDQKWFGNNNLGSDTHGVPLDDQWHIISEKSCENWADIFGNGLFPAGTYTITFTPAGTAKYWGIPGQTEADGVWVDLPSGKTITVEWTLDQTLTVALGADIET